MSIYTSFPKHALGIIGVFILGICLTGSLYAQPTVNEDEAADQSQEEVSEEEATEEVLNEEEQAILEERKQEQRKELFQQAYQSFNNKDYSEAGTHFYHYLNISDSGDENYEWAHFFYGVSLDKLGYTHAAVDTFSHLVIRKPNTKIVTYILGMFDVISRRQPFDEELLVAQALNSTDYGFVEEELASIVHYYQGVYDWSFGLEKWAKRHFDKIPENSYYYYKYMYHMARSRISNDDVDGALDILGEILASPLEDEKLLDLVNWTSARLLFEKNDYEKAVFHYNEIVTPVTEQASFLLEEAWNQYNLNKPERAMGLVYAFQAPDFRRFFSPELYILKSFIYKSLCYFNATLKTTEDFHKRYTSSLQAIRDRKGAENKATEALLLLILNDEAINLRWEFLQLLEGEKQRLQKLDDEDFRAHLDTMYSMKINQHARALKLEISDEFEYLANKLLQYEESINLVSYEVGVDRYQGVIDNRYVDGGEKTETKKKVDTKDKVVYPFQGEFWNDELDSYTVSLPNICNKDQTWEVFFE